MAGMPRIVIPGYPHHVTQRGNRRKKTFFCDDDYRYYIENHQADSIRRNTRTGRPLGTAEFIDNLERLTGKPLVPKRPGRKPSKPK